MNCATHPEAPAAAYCRACGKALCNDCRREWQGVIFCDACVGPQQTVALPPRVAPSEGASPGLAFLVGLIPGVGAIYNGQYGKGILHVVVLGLLISIVKSDAAGELTPLFGLLIPAWILYMALEAYHTAKRRLAGLAVDEFSGLFPAGPQPGRVPLGPLALILLGAIFLLHTMGFLQLARVLRFWPLLLIVAGVYWLYVRLAGRPPAAPGEGGEPGASPS